MKLIELHILQSFPVSCLNRDDLNSPKTATFGGIQRARVSSQCWKRAVREAAADISPHFKGERTRLIVEPLRDALIQHGFSEADAKAKAIELSDALSKYDTENEKKTGTLKVKTIFFTSPAEIKSLAAAYAETKDVKKAIKSLKPEHLKDAADIALFGRMVASDHSLTVEGAAMFSHALSTHKVDNEIDFFTAVDDRNPSDDSGSGHMGTTEFNSATYYRYVAVNLDMLADKHHLECMTVEERKDVLAAFIRATLEAVPQARHNSMNAGVRPAYVLGLVRPQGQPIQLVNAFEKGIWKAKEGITNESIEFLKEEHASMKRTWNLQTSAEVSIPDVDVETFINQLVSHAV